MSKELNKAPVEQAEPASCQGTNCGTTTGDHSSECLVEAAASQGWELKPGDLCGRDCPMRPATAEQAGGDERVVDGKPRATKCPDCGEGDLMPGDLCACGYETDPAAGYACSECDGSGDGYVGEVCRECDGSGWFVTPEQARAALAQPSPAQAEGAQVIGCLCGMPMTEGHHSPDGCCNLEEFAPQAQAEKAEVERPVVVARVVHSNPFVLDHCGPLNANDELMTIAQHAASVARWAEMFNRVEQERDAALARVAELTATRNRYGVDAHYFNKNLQRILRDFESFMPDELARSLIILAKVADEKVVAQHSVPEGWKLVPMDPTSQMTFVGQSLRYDAVNSIGEIYRQMLAAAPGTEVPQAWLDVQAERRRQITAEGWTPDHDDLYCAAELPRAAAAYILSGANDEAPAIWPFVAKWWKPRDARANYVRAGALILAEIERLDRAAAPGKEGV